MWNRSVPGVDSPLGPAAASARCRSPPGRSPACAPGLGREAVLTGAPAACPRQLSHRGRSGLLHDAGHRGAARRRRDRLAGASGPAREHGRRRDPFAECRRGVRPRTRDGGRTGQPGPHRGAPAARGTDADGDRRRVHRRDRGQRDPLHRLGPFTDRETGQSAVQGGLARAGFTRTYKGSHGRAVVSVVPVPRPGGRLPDW